MKIKHLYALFFLLISSIDTKSYDLSKLPFPYCNLQNILPVNNHGWYKNREWINNLFQHNKISTVIEVGSWLGLSTTHITSLLPENGYLYAVDTWLGSNETAYLNHMIPTLYAQFLSNMIHHNLTNKVIPVKMTSLEAAIHLKSEIGHIDLIYLDAAHDTESVFTDLKAYFPYVTHHNGIMCGDDWGWDSVKTAVINFAKINDLSLYYGDNFWFLKEEQEFHMESFINKPNTIWIYEYKQ